MIAIVTEHKLEKVFIDVCGPFPRSGGVHRWKYILILVDACTKFTKLYPLNKANTRNIINVILQKYITEVGRPDMIISDHATQFKGKSWKITLLEAGIKTYKTSVYHPSSNLAERVLREVGRILQTYCHQDHQSWTKYLEYTEESIN